MSFMLHTLYSISVRFKGTNVVGTATYLVCINTVEPFFSNRPFPPSNSDENVSAPSCVDDGRSRDGSGASAAASSSSLMYPSTLSQIELEIALKNSDYRDFNELPNKRPN